jgi:hypothetical protein
MCFQLTPKPAHTANVRKTNPMSEFKTSGEKFLPVFFVDEVKIGEEFSRGEWPLHVTLFPPLETHYDEPLGKAIRFFVNPASPFYATVVEEDIFGPQEAIDEGQGIFVRKLEKESGLMKVHQGLVKALHNLRHDPTFRTPYNPHVSIDRYDLRLQEGDSVWIEGLSIAMKQPDATTWQVVDKIRLKGEV